MTPEEFSKLDPAKNGQDQDSFSYPASQQNNIAMAETPTELKDGVFVVPEETRAAWKAKGEIGLFESMQRLDKSEMIPVWGGVESTYKSVQLLNAVNRIKGDAYTDPNMRDQDVSAVGNFLMSQEEERTRGITIPGMIGTGIAQSLPFMGEFILTGGIASMVKSGAKAGLKFALQEGVERNVARLSTRVVGSLAVGAARTAANPQRIAEATTRRRLQSNFEVTDKGIKLMGDAKEGWASALMKGTADTFIDQYTEEQGAFMGRVAGKFVPKPLRTSLEKLWSRFHPNEALAKLYSKTGFNGFLEELGEEGLGDLIRAVTGLEDFGAEDPHRMLDRVIAAFDNPEKWLATAGVIGIQGGAGLVFEHGLNAIAGDKPSFQERTEPAPAREMTDEEADALADRYAEEVVDEAAQALDQANAAARAATEAVDMLLEQASQPGSPMEALKPALESVKAAMGSLPQQQEEKPVQGESVNPEDDADTLALATETTASIIARTKPGDERSAALSKRKSAAIEIADSLNPGDKIVLADGTIVTIESKVNGGEAFAIIGSGNGGGFDVAAEIIPGRATNADGKQIETTPAKIVRKAESDSAEPEGEADTSFDFGANAEEAQALVTEEVSPTVSRLQEKLNAIHDDKERGLAAKEALRWITEQRKFFKKRIKLDKYSKEAEEFSRIPEIYQSQSKYANTMDQMMDEANNSANLGLKFEDSYQMADYLIALEKRRREVIDVIESSKEKSVTKKESTVLKQRIRDTLAGEKYGYSQGYKDARKKIGMEMRMKVADVKNSAKWIQTAKDLISDYAREHLPKEIQGKALLMVRDAKDAVDVYEAFEKIDALAEAAQKKNLIGKLKNMLASIESAKNIAIDYKQRIQDFLKDFDIGKRSVKFRQSLESTKKWIDSQLRAGKDVTLEQYVYDSLKVLDQTNIHELSNEQIESMIDSIALAVQLGKTKLAARQALKDAEKEQIVEEAEADTRAVNSREGFKIPFTKAQIRAKSKEIGKPLTLWQKLKNRFVDEYNLGLMRNMARQPIDHMFTLLGGSIYKNFKKRMDAKYSDYKVQWRDIRDRARALGQKLGLEEGNYERIGVFAADQQENGRKKLLLRYTQQEIEAVQLTHEEMMFYEFMRSELENIRPAYEKMLREVFNLPLGKVANYFPFMTDYSQFENWTVEHHFNALADYDPHLKKTVDLTPQKQRVDNKGNQFLKVNALEVFEDHMEAVVYAINTADTVKTLQEVASSKGFKVIAGDIGQRMVREWLDLMARMGWSGKKKADWEKVMDFVRKAVGAKALIGNMNSILLQTTAMMDGAGLIGGWSFRGQRQVFNSEWRKFALDSSGKLKERVGDDPAFRDMGSAWFDKLRSKLFTPQKWVDAMVATGVWIGAYQKYCEENNIEADPSKPNAEAKSYADKIVVMTQSSSEFIDAPLLLTRGIGYGESDSWAKFIFQFQGPLFSRYSNLIDIGGKALAEGDKKLFAQIAGWNAAATISEMLIRHGTKAFMGAVFLTLMGSSGDPDKNEDDESNPVFDFLKELLETEAGNVPYVNLIANALSYGSVPVPALGMIGQVGETYKWYLRSKDPAKKAKWGMVLGLEASGLISGIPPSALTKLVKQYYNATDSQGSVGT